MRRHIQLWGTRVFMIALVIVAAQRWGMPFYKQYFTPKKVEVYVPTAKVQVGKFVVSFHEMGTLDAEKSVPVITEVGGKIISLIPDGTVISAGARLAEMDATELERELRNKLLAYQNTLADVDRAMAELEILKKSNETEVRQAEAQLEFDRNELDMAKSDLEKKKRLAEEKLVPLAEVDRADMTWRSKQLAVTKGELALELKRKEVESKERQKQADVRNVEYRADIARMDKEDVERRIESAVVTASTGGLVVITKDWTADGRRKLQEGDSVRPRQTICTLPDLSSMQVKINVGEADAPRISLGLPVLIRLEAVPNKVFHGTVKDISSLATEPSRWETNVTPGRKNFEVVVAVKEADPEVLKPGMTADVEFICEEMYHVIYVPIESVSERSGKTYVYVKEGGKYRQVAVETGKRNDNFVCITKGLTKGQIITLRDPTIAPEEEQPGTKENSTNGNGEKKKAAPLPGADEV